MGLWTEAVVFGVALLAFVLGLSSLIMGFLPDNSQGVTAIKNKVEYGFFGAAGLVVCALFVYAM